MLEHHFRPVDVGLDGVDRLLDNQLDADRRRQVEDHVALIHDLGDQRLVGDRIHRYEKRAAFQVLDVVDRPGGEVVEDPNLVTRAAACQRDGTRRTRPRR